MSRSLRHAIAYALRPFGRHVFRSMLDPQPIVSVPVNTLVMVTGPPGSGKGAQVLTPMLALINEPMVYMDPQREAVSDVPVRRALGRYVFVFDPRIANSASTNVLMDTDPTSGEFRETIDLIADDLCPTGSDDAKVGEGLKYTHRALMVAIANEVYFAAIESRSPLLTQAVGGLSTSNMIASMELWATEGIPAFREVAADFLFDVGADPEVISGVSSYLQRNLSWLSDKAHARLVTGETDEVADPYDLLGLGEPVDWFFQPGENLESTASLWRVLFGTVRRMRRSITKEQATEVGTPTWVVIDEMPKIAGAGARTFDSMVMVDRQKGLIPVFLFQHESQIEQSFGLGVLKAWRDSAALRIILTPDAEAADEFANGCGESYRLEVDYSGDGDGAKAQSQRRWAKGRAVPQNSLMGMQLGDVTAKYTNPNKQTFVLQDTGPLFFAMPLFSRYVGWCRAAFPFQVTEYVDSIWSFEESMLSILHSQESFSTEGTSDSCAKLESP
ncbi:MAG: type IV secretory system conjugative DNA transfer family protein [Pseudomonadota bacterium]